MIFLFFVLGACAGSFVQVWVWRESLSTKLKNNSIFTGRSVCDNCRKQLAWYDNIPIVSFLCYRGKSRCCGKSIPNNYLWGEVMSGVVFVMCYMLVGLKLELIVALIFVALLQFQFWMDLKYFLLSTVVSLTMLGLAIIKVSLGGEYVSGIVGMGIAAGLFGGLVLVTRGRGMASGDWWLSLPVGMWLGWQQYLVAVYGAFLFGALAGSALLIFKKSRKDHKIPFGPFIAIGFVLGLLLPYSEVVKLIIR